MMTVDDYIAALTARSNLQRQRKEEQREEMAQAQAAALEGADANVRAMRFTEPGDAA